MDFEFADLHEAIFINRDNRFRAEILVKGEQFKAHVPNSGRMGELLVKGAKIWVKKAEKAERKTPYDLLLVEKDNTLVCLNAHFANNIFEAWLKKGKLEEFKDLLIWQREKKYGQSRIDFFAESTSFLQLIEVKSVNLVINKQAMFPDAPTVRGTKHLEELINYRKIGHKAAVVFVIMRDDAESFITHDKMDPLFGDTLRKAQSLGVEVYAYKCSITTKGVSYAGKVPILF